MGLVPALPRRAPAILALAVACLAAPASGQDLVYEPINPSFGGNPFNSSHLLGIANAQNDYRDPRATSSNSQADLLTRQLQSRLLSAVSSQIVDAIFGDDPQESGTFQFGDQVIFFQRTGNEVVITITNSLTGEVTEIRVPAFVEVN